MSIGEELRRLRTRVNGMILRAVINRVSDALLTQRVQLTVLDGEVEDDVEHLQPYGLSFVPPASAEMLALSVGGARGHMVGICANAPGVRPTGAAADTGGLYTSTGWKLFIDPTGVVHAGAETGSDFVAMAGLVLARLQAIETVLNTHTHVCASPGNPSAIPVPVVTPTTTTVASTKLKTS